MKKIIIISIILLIISIIFLFETRIKNKTQDTNFISNSSVINKMKISSTKFNNNEGIPSKYTCDGDNVNPPIQVSGVPDNSKSLVLIIDDPDAPSRTWVHWILWNIDPTITEIKEDSIPKGSIEGVTSFGSNSYGGPCPPSGDHRYFFKLYALSKVLDIAISSDKKALEEAIKEYIIATSEFIGLYGR